MDGYGWMQPYLTTPPEQLAAAMRKAGAKGHLVSGQERFYIDWPGGCHMSTPGTKNAPPLIIGRQRTTGNTRAYCFACSRPALDTVHALLAWKPDPGNLREKQSYSSRVPVQDWDAKYHCPGCGTQMLADIQCAECISGMYLGSFTDM